MKIEQFESVSLRLKRLDALILWEALRNAVGLDVPIDYEQIAVALNEAGIATRRGAKFTARVVRVCVNELVEAGLVELREEKDRALVLNICDNNKSCRDLLSDTVHKRCWRDGCDGGRTGAEDKVRTGADVLRRVDGNGGDPDSRLDDGDDHDCEPDGDCCFGSDPDSRLDSESRPDSDSRPDSRPDPVSGDDSVSSSVSDSVGGSGCSEDRPYIYKYSKYRNKKINKTRAYERRAQIRNRNTSRSVAEVVGRVDVKDAEGEAARRRLVGVVWEPSLRRELVDRAVAAVKLGFVSLAELMTDARRAVEKARKSSRRIWEFFTLDVKSYFDSREICWVPTEPGAEDAPLSADAFASVAFDSGDEPAVYEDAEGRTFVSYRRKRL